jgi:hypothetical protein
LRNKKGAKCPKLQYYHHLNCGNKKIDFIGLAPDDNHDEAFESNNDTGKNNNNNNKANMRGNKVASNWMQNFFS